MRIMRLLVMFDLPTKTKADKDNYIKFKRFLDDDGYQREQNSVYSRNLLSRASSESHADQLRKHLPPAGHVVAMELTEKQYVDRKVLVNTNPSNGRDDQGPGTQLFLEFYNAKGTSSYPSPLRLPVKPGNFQICRHGPIGTSTSTDRDSLPA